MTTKDGVVIAGADQRHDHWSDWGNIDTVIRTSNDQGESWSAIKPVMDLKSQPYNTGTQSAFLIDPAMITTQKGRVWMLVDMFPESTGFGSIAQAGNGFIEAEDGKSYLALTDAKGKQYTLRNSDVYDADGKKTRYTVDPGSVQNAFHNAGDLYDDGEYVGNIYLSSQNKGNDSAPLQVLKTSYLWLTYSDDNGNTWNQPINISGQVKADWMKFCGTGPGFGIELQNGDHAGRLVFPIYYTNTNGFQSSASVYSDDNGLTWHRSMSPNDARGSEFGDSQNPNFSQQLTESQIIELKNGHLLQFMRNAGGNGLVAVSRSVDGGQTWSAPISTQATEVYCQLSVLHHGMTKDGKDQILLSNPGGSGRNNGTLRIGVVTENEDDFQIEWTTSKLFSTGNYAYSCLTKMSEDRVGLLYEKFNTIKFTSFNLDYLNSEVNQENPIITAVDYSVEKETEHPFTLSGDTYVFTVHTNQNVTVRSKPTLRFMLDGKPRYAQYRSGGNNDKTVVFEYTVQKEDQGSIAFRGPKIISDEKGSVRNETGLSVSATDMEVNLGYIGVDPAYDGNDIPTENATISTGSSQPGQDASNAIDGNLETLWHTEWSAGHNRADHWLIMDYGKEYMIDGFRYKPRQTQSNGIITEYKIETSKDGQSYTEVAKGKWDLNNAWKKIDFDPVKARYVKLSVLDAYSSEADNDYASAAEVRATGTEITLTPVDKTSLQAEYDQIRQLDLESYTEKTRQVAEDALSKAQQILEKDSATQEDVDKVLKLLQSAKEQLTKQSVDKNELEKTITQADGYALDIDSYTQESRTSFWQAYHAAKALLMDQNALQEQIDEAALHLKDAIDHLVVAQKISTSTLEYTLELAQDVDSTGVIDSIVSMFNERKAAAQQLLEKAKAQDSTITQSMIDQSWKDLLEIMQYMKFKPGDRTELQKVYDLAKSLNLSDYLKEGQQEFLNSLEKSKNALNEEYIEQDEIDSIKKSLIKVMSELRLKPSKGALEELLSIAKKIKTDGLSKEIQSQFKSALEDAQLVFDDDQATKEEVESVSKALQTIIDQIHASEKNTEYQQDHHSIQDTSGKKENTEAKNSKKQSSAKTGIWLNEKTMVLASIVSSILFVILVAWNVLRKRH